MEPAETLAVRESYYLDELIKNLTLVFSGVHSEHDHLESVGGLFADSLDAHRGGGVAQVQRGCRRGEEVRPVIVSKGSDNDEMSQVWEGDLGEDGNEARC